MIDVFIHMIYLLPAAAIYIGGHTEVVELFLSAILDRYQLSIANYFW